MICHLQKFKREAVRMALTSGLKQKQIATDLGIGLSTLSKWVSIYRDEERCESVSTDVLKELEQLRQENRILKEERDILKKATQFFASRKR